MSLTDLPMRRLWNTALSTADKLLGRSNMLARPLRIHIEVNDFCNLKCPHCPRENPESIKNSGHVPVEAIRRLAPYFKYANYVGLTGNGEPFMHPDIMEIVNTVAEQGATPSVISNGTLWARRGVIEDLTKVGPMLLMISFDGGTKETFEKWRRPAKWETVLENLGALRDAKKKANTPFPVLNFIVCLMKDNINELENIVDLAAEFGIGVILFQNMYPYVEDLQKERVLDLEYCNKRIAEARKKADPLGIRIEWHPMAFDVEDRASSDSAYGTNGVTSSANGNGHRYYCTNVWEQIHITVKGEVKFCCWWKDGAIGDLTKDDLGTLWNSPEWVKLRSDIAKGDKPRSCVGCHNLVPLDRSKLWTASKKEIRDLLRTR